MQLLGPMPTPSIAYLTRTMHACAGIVISASHNPYFDNGIKIFGPDGYKLDDAMEVQIEDLLVGDELGEDEPCAEQRLDDDRHRGHDRGHPPRHRELGQVGLDPGSQHPLVVLVQRILRELLDH
mgnify:CR=1 FL=1